MIPVELPTKLLMGGTGLIIVVTLAATDPTALIVLGLLGVLSVILALLAGRAETEAALASGIGALRHSMRFITRTVYSARQHAFRQTVARMPSRFPRKKVFKHVF